jgi:hypothetical protein
MRTTGKGKLSKTLVCAIGMRCEEMNGLQKRNSKGVKHRLTGRGGVCVATAQTQRHQKEEEERKGKNEEREDG